MHIFMCLCADVLYMNVFALTYRCDINAVLSQQSGTGQRNQNASIQQKSQMNKSAYNSYNWGAN